jgi:hypothetical protein
MTQPSPSTPEEMDAIFHQMVWSGAMMKAAAKDK